MKLYQSDHPYYGADGNQGYEAHYATFAEFLATEEPADRDLNHLYRWDWLAQVPGDDERPHDTLHLFFVLQRKGLLREVTVAVSFTDEPEVRRWLTECAEHLITMWRPIL